MEKHIYKKIVVPLPIKKVWKAWTDKKEIINFFAPKAGIELEIGGMYELYFLLDNPPGLQGSEGAKILSYIPEKMLSFSWNAPPEYPEIRKQKTWVVIFFEGKEKKTSLELYHFGWKKGKDWNEVYDYFQNAWELVLKRFRENCETIRGK